MPFVITNRGELNPAAHRLLSTMCDEHLLSMPDGPPADGVAPERRRSATLRKLRTELLITHASGVGRILAGASVVPWRMD